MFYWYKKSTLLVLAVGLGLTACTSAAPQALPTESNAPEPAPVIKTATSLPTEPAPSGAEAEFSTDFNKHSVPYDEILSGGPSKDGIPPIDNPTYDSVSDANAWLNDREPVVLVQVGDEARAYPLQILTWHEIVNDTFGDKPLVVSFCPLCNTAIAFERTFNGQVLDFGTTGRLRYSNLIMYDRQTETWWQQATGDAIAGELTGTQLAFYPASIISWADFKTQYPEGSVLSKETGYNRSYGRNPYPGYDDISQSPFLYTGELYVDQLPAMARVLTIELEDETVAYPYDVLREQGVVNDEVGGESAAIFWVAGTASALDTATIEDGQDVGAALAYLRQVAGRTLSFTVNDGIIRDNETGSIWNIFGQATAGELEGETLPPIISVNHFWFSWAAFQPETRIYQP